MSETVDGRSLYEALEPHLARARLAPYLVACNGVERRAIRLYQWNIELSGAVYQALHVVEVVLRNAIDSQLCTWNALQADGKTGEPLSRDWRLFAVRGERPVVIGVYATVLAALARSIRVL